MTSGWRQSRKKLNHWKNVSSSLVANGSISVTTYSVYMPRKPQNGAQSILNYREYNCATQTIKRLRSENISNNYKRRIRSNNILLLALVALVLSSANGHSQTVLSLPTSLYFVQSRQSSLTNFTASCRLYHFRRLRSFGVTWYSRAVSSSGIVMFYLLFEKI